MRHRLDMRQEAHAHAYPSGEAVGFVGVEGCVGCVEVC